MWILPPGRLRSTVLVLAALTGTSVSGFCQAPTERDTTPAVTLDAILSAVRTANPDLKASKLDATVHLERGKQIALPDPSVMLTYFPEPVFTARGSQQWQFRAEQQFPFPGKLRLQREIAETEADVSRHRTEDMEDQLLFEAKSAYYRLYRVVRQEVLISEFQDQLKGFEEAASTRYVVGEGPQQAILKAQLERNMLSSRLIMLENQRRMAETMLARLGDRDESERVVPVAELTLPEVPDDSVEELVAAALDRRPKVAAIDASGRTADFRIALARKQLMPDFGLSVTYFGVGSESYPAMADGKDALAVAASVRVPLYRRSKKAGVELERVRRQQVTWDRQAVEVELRTRIADLVSRMRQESDQVQLFRDVLIPKAETTRDATMSEYVTGRMSFLDLLDAERMLFSLRTSVEESIERYLVAASELERVMGITSLTEITN